MREAARLSAAMEILDAWLSGSEIAIGLIENWGRAHRFAGRKDRAAIADLVFTAIRRRNSAALLMGDESGRALILGSAVLDKGLAGEALGALIAAGGPHAPVPLSNVERLAMARGLPSDAAPWTRLDYPSWLHERLVASLGESLETEGCAWQTRAPLDIRVNELKIGRGEAARALAKEGLEAQFCPYARHGLRLAPGAPIARTTAYLQGLIEPQDEGSQIIAQFCQAMPGMIVVDVAAGAGGKSLALAAQMGNDGRIIAADIDAGRLARLAPRAERAGVKIIESRPLSPWQSGPDPDFADLAGTADLVIVDAPCSGMGTWRRDPESKWRLTAERLERFMNVQGTLLRRAAALVRAGGQLVYATCSLLDDENAGAIRAFLRRGGEFALNSPEVVLARTGLSDLPCARSQWGVTLSPARTGTDGFFAATMTRFAKSG